MNIRAMVVDDSGIMRKMVMRSLQETKLAAFTFEEAQDGLDALGKFDPQKVQMIFVDWNMPNMSGIDFVRQVRQQDSNHIPIVMITTESTMAKVEEALDEAGVDTFIVKPFTVEVLRRKLAPLLEKLDDPSKGEATGFFGKLAAKLA